MTHRSSKEAARELQDALLKDDILTLDDEFRERVANPPAAPELRALLQDLLNNYECSCTQANFCTRCQVAIENARAALAGPEQGKDGK